MSVDEQLQKIFIFTIGDIEDLKDHDDPKLRCIMACVMEKEGIVSKAHSD